jgi:hypothetical protein
MAHCASSGIRLANGSLNLSSKDIFDTLEAIGVTKHPLPRKAKSPTPDTALAPISSDILERFVREGPLSPEELDTVVRRFKKAVIERAGRRADASFGLFRRHDEAGRDDQSPQWHEQQDRGDRRRVAAAGHPARRASGLHPSAPCARVDFWPNQREICGRLRSESMTPARRLTDQSGSYPRSLEPSGTSARSSTAATTSTGCCCRSARKGCGPDDHLRGPALRLAVYRTRLA